MLLAVLLGLEYAMIAVPNVQLTVVILMVYASILPLRQLLPLVAGYVLLDNLLMGSLNILYFIPMMLAWFSLVIVTFYLKNKHFLWIIVFATLFGFIYGWFYLPVQMFLYGMDRAWPYLMADLPFEAIMALNNLLTVLILYLPIRNTLNRLLHPEMNEII